MLYILTQYAEPQQLDNNDSNDNDDNKDDDDYDMTITMMTNSNKSREH